MTQAEVNAYEARRRAAQALEAKWPAEEFDSSDSESELHSQIFDECRRRGWIALHGSMAERTHRNLGEPDFVIIGSMTPSVSLRRTEPRVWFIECKSRTGKLSPAQLAMKVHAEKLGHTIHVVRSFDQFLRVVEGV